MAGRNHEPRFPVIPEFLWSMIGNDSPSEWDSSVTLIIYRLIPEGLEGTAGNGTIPQPSLPAADARDDQESSLPMNRLQERMCAINALRLNHLDVTPLEALRSRIAAFFTSGPVIASFIFEHLHAAVSNRSTEIDLQRWDHLNLEWDNIVLPWSSDRLAAALVLVTASTERTMFDALRSQSHNLRGLPTLFRISNTPTASFSEAFAEAKTVAEKRGQTTVIGVSFTDVEMIRLAKDKEADQYSSFAHNFVVGVGPEGVVIWQAWGEPGYRLDEYINRGGARVRSWSEARQFVLDFERLATAKGGWNCKKNKWYRRCFEVDINKICAPKGPRKAIVPHYDAWVKLHIMNDVKLEHIHKFNWG